MFLLCVAEAWCGHCANTASETGGVQAQQPLSSRAGRVQRAGFLPVPRPPGSAMGVLGVLQLALLLLSTCAQAGISKRSVESALCTQPNDVRNGTITLSKGLETGSVLILLCDPGFYPNQVNRRTCQENGKWSAITTRRLYCKEMLCPKPLEFEFGEQVSSTQVYTIKSTVQFTCYDGYSLRGSAERTCMPNGKWSGTTAICDNKASHCPNPGVPIGARKTGTRYQIDDKVMYKCDRELDLVGSQERVCQESGEWSGIEPSCQSKYSYDLPEDVRVQFDTSVSNILEVMNPFKSKEESLGRKVTIAKNGTLNIYILVDASKSVEEKNFEEFKKAVNFFILAFSNFDVFAHFGILSYATEAKVLISVYDDDSANTPELMHLVNTKMKYEDHQDKSGTNIQGALDQVYKMMSLQKERIHERQKEDWHAIRHAILLLTDGKSNVGGRPKEVIDRITRFLEIEPNRRDYLDVYAFGIGALEVDKAELSEIASKKKDEQHVFVMKSAEDLKDAFDSMLDLNNTGDMCGLSSTSENTDPESLQQRVPWHALIQLKDPICRGSLVAKNWVLTAAHCFHGGADQAKAVIGGTSYKIAQIFQHPCYDVSKLKDEGIKEFYDYDIALLKLEKPVRFSEIARPICIPCTESTHRALKLPPGKKTCKDHKDTLMPLNEMTAKLVTIHDTILDMPLMLDNKRDACTNGIKAWPGFENIDISKMMRPRYLCSQSIKGSATCKGESGGALFVTSNRRHYEMGVVSWGVFDACRDAPKGQRKPPPNRRIPRDFYISLFEVQPWLKYHLGKDLPFLNDIKASSACPDL
ncbi:complement C2-like [Ambystoma mexicanum]|uniref:complement C2-like n=1 Tax=Ambystoma mexicanum TaxID=8296 RepID=UPI0037E70320